MTPENPSFLDELLRKKSTVLEIGDATGKNVDGALREVNRQITQASRGNPITGEGVTKSGVED